MVHGGAVTDRPGARPSEVTYKASLQTIDYGLLTID